jgi:hypothetical protein
MDNYEKIGVQEVELKMVSEVSIRYEKIHFNILTEQSNTLKGHLQEIK